MQELIEQIKMETSVRLDSIHGQAHWDRVAAYGRAIAEGEAVELRIILLFAHFHDCQRHSDGRDPAHGLRAGRYVRRFGPDRLGLSPRDIERLIFACRYHTYDVATRDRTIRACWDADRLDLGRCGITPDPHRLFTRTARRIAAEGGTGRYGQEKEEDHGRRTE
jgi:uncharacterized protein